MSDPAMASEVIRRWPEQTPIRRIADQLRISRYLVKRIIVDHQDGRTQGVRHPDLPTPPESRGSILDGHLPFIQDLLTRWPAITALRIHEELRGRGFSVNLACHRYRCFRCHSAGTQLDLWAAADIRGRSEAVDGPSVKRSGDCGDG